jgi:acetylornithine deacetylase/succinyl-diaminopimelate desuccinylase-like protein
MAPGQTATSAVGGGDGPWQSEFVERHLDRQYLVETLSQLARVPTDVPLGYQTLIQPDDEKLVHYVQDVVRPELVKLGVYDLLDVPPNNLVAQVGTRETDQSLLIQNYTVAQHHNLMVDPFSGKVANARTYGTDEPAVFGQGVSQAKAHQAVMLAVLKMLRDGNVQLRGRLYWAVNNEGQSSHACSEAIIGALDRRPAFGIIQLGTGLRLQLGNRGRVDVNVHVQGKATHSSTPHLGQSAIDGAYEVLTRLKQLHWPDSHPLLGGRHAIAYKIRYEPLAPHTLPSDAYVIVDRRLLPGDDLDAATDEVRAAIGDLSPYQVTVERGVHMLPALVDADHPGVRALQAANLAVRGQEAESYYALGTFDAGGPCALGVPTVQFGASGGVRLLGPDFVAISAVETEARVLAHVILTQLA